MRRRRLGVELRPGKLLPGRPPLVLPLARPEGWGGGVGRGGRDAPAKARNHPVPVRPGDHSPSHGSGVEITPRLLSAYYVLGSTQCQVCKVYLIILFTLSPPPQLEVDGAIVLIFTGADTGAPGVTAQGQLRVVGFAPRHRHPAVEERHKWAERV